MYVHANLKRKRELFALLLLTKEGLVAAGVLGLFLTVPWVGLQCVIEAFPDHTHLLFVPYVICSSLFMLTY